MKEKILSLFVFIAVIFTFSCNTTVESSSKSSSARTSASNMLKVMMLYGNYSVVSNNKFVKLIDGKNSLLLPLSTLIDGKALFGSNSKNLFHGALLFKDEGTTHTQITNFLKLSGSGYSSNFLDPSLTSIKTPPLNPPGCGIGGCPGMLSFQMSTFEINMAVPMVIEATTR
jgi:hypothetical protein